MTAQMPDVLIYKGEKLELFCNPLEIYFEREERARPSFVPWHTANWRGYVATWEIDDDRLYLMGIVGRIQAGPDPWMDSRMFALDDLFPECGDRVEAKWFTGQLRVPRGEVVNYVHLGYFSEYEQDLIFFVEGGKVVETMIVDNRRKE